MHILSTAALGIVVALSSTVIGATGIVPAYATSAIGPVTHGAFSAGDITV